MVGSKNLPIILAQLANHKKNKLGRTDHTFSITREAQRLIAKEEQNTTLVVTYDAKRKDHAHFQPDSYKLIGQRFADAAWAALDKKNVTIGPRLHHIYFADKNRRVIRLYFNDVVGKLLLIERNHGLHILDGPDRAPHENANIYSESAH